jgi:hypothetical protein
MSLLILILLPIIVLAIFIVRSVSRPQSETQSHSLQEPRHFDGLFAKEREQEAAELQKAEAEIRREAQRMELLARAWVNDETCLDDAHAFGERDLYNEVLDAHVIATGGNAEVLKSIMEYIVDSGALRATPDFATRMLDQFPGRCEQRTLADLIYLAALSDDPEVFERAIDQARTGYRSGRILRTNSRDFLAIIEHSYWLLSPEVRYSGTGFLLKRLVADVRRELAVGTRLSA